MKFKVECREFQYDSEIGYEFTGLEPITKGDVGLLIVSKKELLQGHGVDGAYRFTFGTDHFIITTSRRNPIDIPEWWRYKAKKADGVFFVDYIKIHYKTFKDKLLPINPGDKIEITTWDEEYNQEAITHDLNEVRKALNAEIEKRQMYGVRTYKTTKPGYQLSWSNAATKWMRGSTFYLPEAELKLDANYIYAPFTVAEIDRVIEDLAPLPLFAYSFEAKAAIAERSREDLEKALEKLEKEFDIAQVENDLLKQRNITFTMKYIESLLEEKRHLT